MDLNLDILAQETIDLSKTLDEKFPRQFDGLQLDLLDLDHHEQEEGELIDEREYHEPQGPGLAFRIEKGAQTFCIRAALVDQIEYLPNDLEQGDRRLYQALRIDELKQLRDVYTFETETIELAEVIIDQFCNRRFPYHEEDLFNISDPGFSWWLDEKPGAFQIIFQSPGMNGRYQTLGPLGDSTIAARRFQTVFQNLAERETLEEMVATNRLISLKHGANKHDGYTQLLRLIKEGLDISSHLKFNESFKETREHKTILFFLKEFSYLRQFWLSIEERL
jgi:hypothetical protein